MKTTHLRMLCLVLGLLFLFGCAPQGETPSGSVGTTPSEASNPTAPSGSIPAAPVTFDLNTAMKSTFGRMWETEAGFYYDSDAGMIYADKSDLSNWVIVCSKPDCRHDRDTCPARILGGGFYLKDGRIYSVKYTSEFIPDAEFSYAVYSTPADGSDDFRLEYPLDQLQVDQPRMKAFLWRPDALYLCYDSLLPSGNWVTKAIRLDADGEHLLHSWETEERVPANCFEWHGRGTGDTVVCSMLLEESVEDGIGGFFRLTGRGYEPIPNAKQYWMEEQLHSGDGMYRFTRNDGYYYTELSSDHSVKWMQARLKESRAKLFGTNCIVETNLDADPRETGLRADERGMQIYDGTMWKTVALPDTIDLTKAVDAPFWALASDRLFFSTSERIPNGEKQALYMVDLTQDELKAVRCAEIR